MRYFVRAYPKINQLYVPVHVAHLLPWETRQLVAIEANRRNITLKPVPYETVPAIANVSGGFNVHLGRNFMVKGAESYSCDYELLGDGALRVAVQRR